MNGETIVILANAEWDWVNRVNCHHLAARLAPANRVLFVETVGGRTPAPREFKKVIRRLRRVAGGIREVRAGLRVLSPFVLPIYGSDVFRRLNTRLLAWQIRRAIPRTRPVLWFFLPSLVGLVGHLNEKRVIYHCIDEHAANPNVPAHQVMEWERQLLGLANVVFASSSTLYESKRRLNTNTYYLPNVADTAHLEQARAAGVAVAEDLRDIPRPIAGFVGNLTAYKVDFELLAAVAQARPDWSFVLIGPVGRGDPSTDISSLRALPNVYWLGERDYEELPRYLKGFDVCLIPFRQNDSTRGTLPMKFFEYLAAGKPVVATDLPALAEFREYFYPARTPSEFAAALSSAAAEDAACAERRIQIARKYSWDNRMLEIERILDNAPGA